MLTQHLLAFAAQEFRRRSDFHQTSHSIMLIWVESKPTFRCGLFQQSSRGLGGHSHFSTEWLVLVVSYFTRITPIIGRAAISAVFRSVQSYRSEVAQRNARTFSLAATPAEMSCPRATQCDERMQPVSFN
jgi:hypothetical protein